MGSVGAALRGIAPRLWIVEELGWLRFRLGGLGTILFVVNLEQTLGVAALQPVLADFSTAGACRATSQVERLNSSAANSVAGAVSVRDGVEGIVSMRGLLVLMSGPEPFSAQPSVAP